MSSDNTENLYSCLSNEMLQKPIGHADNLRQVGICPLESNKECIDLLRMLIEDNAFSTDFLISAIFGYYEYELIKENERIRKDLNL